MAHQRRKVATRYPPDVTVELPVEAGGPTDGFHYTQRIDVVESAARHPPCLDARTWGGLGRVSVVATVHARCIGPWDPLFVACWVPLMPSVDVYETQADCGFPH